MLNYEEIYQSQDRMADPAKVRRIFQPNHFRSAGVRLFVLTMLGCILSLLFSPAPTLYAQSTDEGLVGYWPFDEGSGTTSADRSGNGNTAILSAGASFTTTVASLGRNNPAALTFQGKTQAIAAGRGLANLHQLTIAAWVRQTDDKGVQRYVTLGDENAVLRHDGKLHFYLKLNGRLVGERLQTAIPLGGYHHVAGTYDGTMLRVYLDGRLVGSEVASGTVASGNWARFSSTDEPLHGELDEVRIYNRALPAEEIEHLVYDCAMVSEIPQAECQALVALYVSTNGDKWLANNQWLRNNTPCRWLGVTCTDSAVQVLDLHSNHLTGAIPPQLGNLTNLEVLDLSDNQLSGTIPPELGNLANLQVLDLYDNQLSGTIPPDLGNLTNLQHFDLYNNQLSGAIPPELDNLANLQELKLGYNQLSGVIPPQLINLANLQELELDNNQLSGIIPPQLGNLAKLEWLELDNNQLSGSLPTSLCDLLLWSWVDLGYNKFIASDPCFVSKALDWMNTQTIPPSHIQAQVLANHQVQLTWTPITYTAHGGYYTVLAGMSAGGPYTVAAQTVDKTTTGITVGPFDHGTHYLIVRSFTPQHDDQQNDLTSDDSAEVVVVVNQPPMAAAATLTVTQGSILPIHLHASDEDADTLHYSLISLPAHGGVSGAAPDLLYIPAPGFTGEDSFTFKVNDGKVDSSLATITLHIVAAPPVNTPPIAHSQSLTTTQATAIQLLLTATDGENDPLTYQVLSPPAHGVLGGSAPTLIYTPTDGYTGTDSFTFQVSDSRLTSQPTTVEINITAQPNRPPIAQDDAFSVTRNSQAIVLTVLTNDQDADGDALRLLAVDPPLNGTAQLVNDQLLYTPTPDFVGVDRLTYTVSDDKSSSVATVRLTVSAPLEATTSQAIYLPIVQR